MNIYLKVDYTSGNAYEYSKEEKEGYEKHTSDKGNVTYRKYYKKGVFGTLRGVSIREVEFNNSKTKEVSVALRNSAGDNIYLNVPLFNAKKNITDYAEGIISYLGGLVQGTDYRIFPYNIAKEGSKYSNVGVSFKLATNMEKEEWDKETTIPQLKKSYTLKSGEKVVGEIPEIIFEEDFDGSKTMNAKARNKFLYDTLVAFVENGNSNEAPQKEEKPTPKAEEKKSAMQPNTKFENAKIDESDDLPF